MSAVNETGAAHLDQRYDAVFRLFHWAVVALLVMQISTKLVLPYVLPKSAEGSINAWHISLGTTILFLMVLRLAWRLTHEVPPSPADLPVWMRMVSRGTHYAFYAVLVVMPLFGWAAASAYGAPVRLFGLITLPALGGKDIARGEAIGDMHGALAVVLLVLMAAHISGVLYHAFIKRDGVARRMMSG